MKVGDKVKHKEEVLAQLGWKGVVTGVGKKGYWVDVNNWYYSNDRKIYVVNNICWLDEGDICSEQ